MTDCRQEMSKRTKYNLSTEEWEDICDNCGKCCLITLQDEDSGDIYRTNVICRYYDLNKHCCSVYAKRCQLVPECLKLTEDNVDKLPFMPKTCAYRRLFDSNYREKPIEDITAMVVREDEVAAEDLEDYIVDWDDL